MSKDYKEKESNQNLLFADSEIKKDLGWQPEISFDKLVERMVHCDLALNDGP